MEKNVPAERKKCRRTVFYSAFLILARNLKKQYRQSKSETFGVNCNNTKVKPMSFMSMTENNVIVLKYVLKF